LHFSAFFGHTGNQKHQAHEKSLSGIRTAVTFMNNTKTPAPGRMARKKTRTRQALIDATIDLLLAKGYEQLLADEIAERADMGRRTFYNHFAGKEECVLTAVTERFTDQADQIALSLNFDISEREAEDCDHALIRANMASQMFRSVAMDPVAATLTDYPRILSEAIAESQRDRIEENLAKGLLAGRFKPSLPTESLEPILAWAFVGLVVTSIRRKSQHSDSLVWARFVLQNLGISDADAGELLKRIPA
jgi:AcrR family transcriptional regulator